MVPAVAAPVRPRVFVPDASGAVLLENEIRERIEERRWGFIELAGPPGAGKSVALAHLAFVFQDDCRLLLTDHLDQTSRKSLVIWANKRVVVCASSKSADLPDNVERWRMTPWTEDEWIEYLLAVHRDQCASVMQRIKADRQRRWLGSTAGLWRIVLDRLAANETVVDVKSALFRELDARLSPADRVWVRECLFAVLTNPDNPLTFTRQLLGSDRLDSAVRALVRHEQVSLLLAAEHVAVQVHENAASAVLRVQLPEPLLRETAALARSDESLLAKLREVLAGPDRKSQSMAASLLHMSDVGWIPATGVAPVLRMAYLCGAQWSCVRLSQLKLFGADLSGADLSEARLKVVFASDAKLSAACLHGAQLIRFRAVRARLDDADLSFVRAPKANFSLADLRGANLEGALLSDAKFANTDLRGARLCRAVLVHAGFSNTRLDGADFSGADLSRADLGGVVLRVADFTGALFAGACLIDCDMESMSLPGADFEKAMLCGAYLTGSQMPAAKFCGANLKSAGLAEIDWPNTDLRDADLRGATFHLGSSRSGLVGSPIACEGSRTGFYTDEYHEQDFKSPEEIRKANLCGADLRGAKIEGVDFYLVDLRNAKYSREQEAQFRASGAILETRV